ncbi:helix-turn-helix domain-containing protein [Candidatus Cryosericum septentrionale]|jgi:transcriptional regulator with XRE-family HTH domain|uniref:XRE family transcriptional regulator n=1 Tax=Candidatus Cryosericum septentrionale TaxID=2290913 RepID=A0A398E4L3_9BACT|nr:helix-turn-helix transcriptional regulator [Candidatus Cryosericum septentrionale]RIE17561.1 XRE family transcriptional regulator [Candidatus Cryosericum septentrionale]
MGFKENVEVLLSRSHWSQRQLAAAAGISSGRVSQILSNPTSPTLATVTKIASAFGLDVADMVRDETLSAPGDELEMALRHQGDLSSQDIQAVHAFIAYIREARPKRNRRGK